jgi:RNA polymerase sigma factor (sigma-70 family)
MATTWSQRTTSHPTGHILAPPSTLAPYPRRMPDELSAEISRGQQLDVHLARRLGRPEPQRTRAAGALTERLEQHAPLPADAERTLVEAARRGEPEARARLVEAYLPLISGLARTYRSGQVQRQELLQEGVIGLLRALERFDPDRGIPFWSYAAWWVRQAMQQLVAELTRPMVLSDRALRHLSRLKQAHREQLQRSGREPSRAELAERSGLDVEQVDDLLATERPRSLDEPVAGRDGEVGTFGELLVDPLAEGEYERVLAAIEVEELHDLLAGLSERERRVLALRYGLEGEDRSLREVGELLGISGERVRQIENRALGKLAAVMSPPDEALIA